MDSFSFRKVSIVAFALACAPLVAAAQKSAPAPPAAISASAASFKPVTRVEDLPPVARPMAEPGADFNATDVIVDPNLPGRRLIVAGCSATVCAIHYERGGIAHTFRILGLVRGANGWKIVWNVYGPKRLPDYAALRAVLEGRSNAVFWSTTPDDY